MPIMVGGGGLIMRSKQEQGEVILWFFILLACFEYSSGSTRVPATELLQATRVTVCRGRCISPLSY